jgi:putative superfamily III holin-X
MVAQTSVDQTNVPPDPSPPQAVARNTGELLSDAMTLAELQSQLLVLDIQDDLRKLILPLASLLTGIVLALSCLPIALVTIALALVAGTGIAPWLAFLISLAIGLVLASCFMFPAILYFIYQLNLLERSRSEWQQNLRWFKSLVRRLGKSFSRPAEPGHH